MQQPTATRYAEAAGPAVVAGLRKDDPFVQEGCDFGDSKCIVGPGCSKVGQTHQIQCLDSGEYTFICGCRSAGEK